MKVQRITEVTLTHDELCEAVMQWVNRQPSLDMYVDGAEGVDVVEFLGYDGQPFEVDLTARVSEVQG